MKTYEDVFVANVLREMDGIIIQPDEYTGGSFGGVPYVFYDSEMDVADLFSKKIRRTKAEKDEDSDLTSEEFEFRFLRNLGLANDERNKKYYTHIKFRMNKSEENFNFYLKRFRESASESERLIVVRSVVCDIKDIMRRGCSCPGDYLFLRRFGLYA